MRRSRYDEPISRRPILVRGADGRIKASQDQAIEDIWAEQKRLRLFGAIETDRERVRRRKARRVFIGKATATFCLLLRFIVAFVRRHTSIRRLLISGGVIAVVLVSLLWVVPAVRYRAGRAAVGSSRGILDSRAQKPDYSTVLPAGKNIADLGGWGRVSPPDKDPVFAYADQIDGIRITVSQQPLPAGFKDNVKASIADLAKQFSASDVVTADGLTFYIGTSIKGPQSVILAKSGLLILIKSDAKLSHQQWMNYIIALR